MRVDGELACDALALSYTREAENRSYGRTIVKLLEKFSRPTIAPGLVGILENKNRIKQRINLIGGGASSTIPTLKRGGAARLCPAKRQRAAPPQKKYWRGDRCPSNLAKRHGVRKSPGEQFLRTG
jgi:hypothetical protein